MTRVSKVAVSLVSTVAEAVGVKGACSVSLLPEEGRVVQPYVRMNQAHRCIREEQNTLQVDSLGRYVAVVWPYELYVFDLV